VLPLPPLGVTYRDLELHAGFEGDRLLVRRAGATSAKGTLEATGDVRFASVTRIEPRLHVKTKRFVFANSPDLKAMATCELDVTGTFAAPVVKGSVTVASSSLYFTQPDLAAAEAGDDVKLTPADVRMMEETFGYVAPQAPALPLQLYDASDLELAIKMERDNWVRQRVPPKMAVALTGDFKLVKRPHAEPALFGKIEPIPNRGYVQQFARSFDITGGEVLLNGAMKDHAVAIHAQFKPESGVESQSSTDVVVKLDVEGTPDHLKLTLSSDPAMSEAEIVNFIATGRSSAAPPTATNGTSNSTLLRDIGLSQLTGAAESAAQEAVGLDVLEVRYDPLRGATLVAGRYVDPQLYVGFRSPLDYNQNTSPNSSNTSLNSTAFEVEYAISRWLVFNCQGETSKLRSFFRARRAY
jgi:autotransporter translocation and assembly factor TamB